MWLTRIVMVLLGVGVAIVLGIATVVPQPPANELTTANRRGLDQVQHNADLLLKLESREWIDKVSSLAHDAGLVSLLERGNRDTKALSQRINTRLLDLLGQMPAKAQPKLVIATDAQGKQLCRIGPGERRYRPGVDGLAGYPVVEAALRGYQLDDTWSLDGKLYLVAASPVISRVGGGAYVGTLIVGEQLDAVFANKLRARLAVRDVHVGFFLRGELVASTINAPLLKSLPRRFSKLAAQIRKHRRSSAITVGSPAAHTVVMAPLPGEAAAHEAFYAVIGPPPVVIGGLGDAMARVRWGGDGQHFPWLLVAGLALLLALVGVGVVVLEIERPQQRLLDALRKVSKGEASRLDPDQHRGTMRRMAAVTNDAIDRLVRRAPAPRTPAPADAPSTPAAAPASLEMLPDVGPIPSAGNEMPPLADDGVQPLPTLDESPPIAERDASPSTAMEASLDHFAPMRTLEPEEAQTMVEEGPPAAMVEETLPLLSPVTLPDGPLHEEAASEEVAKPIAPLAVDGAERGLSLEGDSPFGSTTQDPADAPSSLQVRMSDRVVPQPLRTADNVMSSAPDESQDKPDPEEEQYRSIYKDFVAIKRQCGENTDNITFERFVAKLKKNRAALIERYNCESVRFQVYVKDGKAALKATPIKD